MAKHVGNPDFRSDLTNDPELLPDEAGQKEMRSRVVLGRQATDAARRRS
ncbi:hypothetical protein WAK64_18220 [Bacillus spongiae]|uniref:YfhD family protein n=1 Tax=Bacillus spongiae TaxID=2683610 RepID=A0ABU8HHW6_9BACI